MPKDITVAEMQRLIEKIKPQLLTSNNIIPRVTQPYYHDHPSVPQALTNFKRALLEYRTVSSKHSASIGTVPVHHPSVAMLGDLSLGSFAHIFVGSLVVASFGIGDCSEISAKLVLEMIHADYGNFTLIGIELPGSAQGMERTHAFVIGNLKVPPRRPEQEQISVYDFFKTLPPNAIIGDAFLGVAFRPTAIPDIFNRYVAAYGRETRVNICFHFINTGPNFLRHFVNLTIRFAREIKPQLSGEKTYLLAGRKPVQETVLLSLLKTRRSSLFFGLVDDDYKVDAVLELKTKRERAIALSLQDSRGGYGRFFRSPEGNPMFVLEGINIEAGDSKPGKYLQSLLCPQK